MSLLRYYLRRSRSFGLLAMLALFLFHYVMAFVYRDFVRNVEGTPAFMLRFIPKNVQTFLGLDRLPIDSVAGFLAMIYQHPFVMVVVCGLAVVLATEFLAGQVERLTIAHLLVRPVARGLLPVHAWLSAALWLGAAIAAGCLGTVVGFHRVGSGLPPAAQLAALGAGLFLLGLAVAGVAVFFSAMTSTRADAAGWSVSILLVMYVGNFVAQLWDAARLWAPLSLFNHYRPIDVFMGPALPLGAWELFAATAAAGLALACLCYAWREFRV